MKFNTFYNLSESDKDGVYANITKRLDDLESKIDKVKPEEEAKYSCVPGQTGDPKLGDVLIIIDVESGTMEGRLATRGRLISHPLVYGTKVAFAIQRENGDRIGVVHTLPDGQLYNQFRITGDAAQGTETSPIFRTEIDTEVIWNDQMTNWINASDEDDVDIKTLRKLIDIKSTQTPSTIETSPVAQPVAAAAPDVSGDVSGDVYGAPVTQTASMRTQSAEPTGPGQPAVQQGPQKYRRMPTARSERMRQLRFRG